MENSLRIGDEISIPTKTRNNAFIENPKEIRPMLFSTQNGLLLVVNIHVSVALFYLLIHDRWKDSFINFILLGSTNIKNRFVQTQLNRCEINSIEDILI